MITWHEVGEAHDFMRPEGHLEVWAVNEDGSEEKIIDEKNLVVDAGLDYLRDRVQGDSSEQIEKFCFGTDSTSESASDTDLGTQVHVENWDSYSDTATGESRWEGLLDSIEPSGQPHDIAEFGVKLSDGTLFARTTFTASTKDNTQEWRVRYTLTFQNL